MSYELTVVYPLPRATATLRVNPDTGEATDDDRGRVDFTSADGDPLAATWVDQRPYGYVLIVQDLDAVKQYEIPLGDGEHPAAYGARPKRTIRL